MPASLTIFSHFGASARISSANAVGETRIGTMNRSANCLAIAGWSAIETISPFSVSTIAFGVAAGATRPYQLAMS